MKIPIHKTDLRWEDVLCGSGKALMHHPGNQTFRKLVKARVDEYFDSDRHVKAHISEEIVDNIQALGGRFLKQNKTDRAWYVIDRTEAMDKTSQALRDMKRRMLRELQQENGTITTATTTDTGTTTHTTDTTTTTTAATTATMTRTVVSPDTTKQIFPFVPLPAHQEDHAISINCESKDIKGTALGGDANSILITTPQEHDVVCGSGRAVMELPGNKAFRAMVKANVDRFVDGDRGISALIVQQVMNRGGRFLKKNVDQGGCWCPIGQDEAVLKTSQALRDARRILLREREQQQQQQQGASSDTHTNNATPATNNIDNANIYTNAPIPTTLQIDTEAANAIKRHSEQDVETMEVANSLYQLSLGTFEASGEVRSCSMDSSSMMR